MNIIEHFKNVVGDDRAVSPVIGVILMVAITVILAAVIGTFVLGLGENVSQTAPTATLSLEASASADTFTIDHTGGDALHSDRTRLIVTLDGTEVAFDPAATDSALSVGSSATFTVDATNNKIDPPSSGTWSDYSSASVTSLGEITSGSTLEVKLIDTQSQKTIFQTEITA